MVRMRTDAQLKNIRIAGMCFLAFFFMLTYSVARPVTESLFLMAHTSRSLPRIWILVPLCMLCAVALYNKVVVRNDLMRLFGGISAISAALFVLLILALKANIPGVYYALYILKDVYVVVLAEIYYSYSNSVFKIKTARWVYGFFGVFGSMGAITGNLAAGFLAQRFGSVNALWVIPPLLMIGWLFCMPFSRIAGIHRPDVADDNKANISEAVRVMRKSSYLFLVLILIALVQIVITLVDFEYNTVIERVYSNVDARTAMIGKIYAIMSLGILVLHSLTGPILKLVTVPGALLAIPLILGTSTGIFVLMPVFATVAIMKVASKCFDYTLFRASKEILYIPLSYEEKTQGKSIVDMLTYRVAKGGASLLLLGLIAIGADSLATVMTLALIAGWFIVTIMVVTRFRKKVGGKEEVVPDQRKIELVQPEYQT
jgi:ATP/ADP translocase